MLLLFTFFTTLLSQELYCEIDSTISLINTTLDQCIQNGWSVTKETDRNTFLFQQTSKELKIQISELKNHSLTFGTNEQQCTLQSFMTTNMIENEELEMNFDNISDMYVKINGETVETTKINTKGKNGGIGLHFENDSNEKKNHVVLRNELSHGKYIRIIGDVEITLNISQSEVDKIENECEPFFVAHQRTTIHENDDGIKPIEICSFNDENARYGICPNGVKTNCKCHYENYEMKYDDCWYHGSDMDLTISGDFTISNDASFKSISFVEESAHIIVNNDAILTVGTLHVPKYFMLNGSMKVNEIILTESLTTIDAYEMKVNKVSRTSTNEIFFIGNIATSPNGLKKTCEGKLENGYSRFVSSESTLDCECHMTNGEFKEEDCNIYQHSPLSPYSLYLEGNYQNGQTSYWKYIVTSKDSSLGFGSIYSENCIFEETLSIGGRIECKEIVGKTITINEMKNLPTDKNSSEILFILGNTNVDQIILNVNGEIIGNVKNIETTKSLIVSGQVLSIENIKADTILVEETTKTIRIKKITVTQKTKPIIQTKPHNSTLFVSFDSIEGNGIVIEQLYRPLKVTGIEMTCNNRYVLIGNMTCDGLIPETIECYASKDGIYENDKGKQIYYCPCDISTTCAHVIPSTYEDDSFTVKKIPTYLVVQKNVSLDVHNKRIDITSLLKTKTSEEVVVTIDGSENTFTILDESGPIKIVSDFKSSNVVKIINGTLTTSIDENDVISISSSDEVNGCIEYSPFNKCHQCIGNVQLFEGECVDPSLIPEDNQHKFEIILAIILLIIFSIISIGIFVLLIVFVLRNKFNLCGHDTESRYELM